MFLTSSQSPQIIIKDGVRLLILCVVLALSICANGQIGLASIAPSESERPSSVTDIDAITHNGLTTVYLIDSGTRKLYRHKTTASSPERLSLNDFEPYPDVQNFQEPSTLTHVGGKLFVCDRGGQAIFEVNTESSKITKLIDQINIETPVSIAVSNKGVIAIGEDIGDRVVTFEPVRDQGSNVNTYKRRILELHLDDPDRLIFIGPDLFVLDTEEGKVSLVEGSASEERTQSVDSLNTLLRSIKSEVTTIQDIAYLNGVFYVASKGRLIAFTPISSHKSFPIFKENAKPSRSSALPRITASLHYLFMKEQSGQAVLKLPRPVPVNINFEPDATSQALSKTYEQQRSALLFLYEYLSEKDILPTREFITRRKYDSFKELLFEQRVLIDPDQADTSTEGKVNSDKRLSNLICKYNPGPCQQSEPLSRSVPVEQKVTLPNIPMEVDLSLIDLSIGKKTVRDMLTQLVTPEQLSQITAEYILRINRSYLQTFETEFARENFIPTSRTGLNLRPGTIIQFENGRERVVGDVGGCSEDFDNLIKKIAMPAPGSLQSKAIENVLPRRMNQTSANGPADWIENISEIVIDSKDLTKESTDLSILDALVQSAGTDPRCRLPITATGPTEQFYIVDQAIKTSGAYYKFLRRDGSQITVSAKDIELANLLGQPYEGKDYSLAVNQPLYFAYTLLRVDMSKPVDQWEHARADQVKAGTYHDIFSATGGVFRLPATRWRLSLFVNATDIYDSASSLNRSLSIPGISLLKEERVETSSNRQSALAVTSYSNGLSNGAPQNQKEIIKNNRKDLLNQIGYFPPVPRLTQVRVGVAEAKGSIHTDHPDFAGVWHQKSGLNDLMPITVDATAVAPADDMIKKFSKKDDHGDHVAGLIAARGDTIPGLAPGVQLFLIDTTNQESEASLEKDINDAIVRDVKIFNLSFTIGGDDAPQVNVSLDKLKTRMRTSPAWRDALFIAAAGNEGRDLADIGDRIPVKWVGDISNIIGVAAADDRNNVLGEWICAPDLQPPRNKCPGSNYSHKYIHLVAPGLNIYSTVSGGRYAPATGSSQAVPQVTAAAAMLYAQFIQTGLHPSIIKGRLIYTADWFSQFDSSDSEEREERKVWGGMLNFRRAVMHPQENLLVLKALPDVVNKFTFIGSSKIKIKKEASQCLIDHPYPVEIPCPDEITFDNILRITKHNGLFRVIYLAGSGTKTLRIIKDVVLEGKIRCEELLEMDATTFQFTPGNKCTPEVDVSNILEYVSKIPLKPIKF